MHRRTLYQAAFPAIAIGLVLLAACLASLWSINRLQENMATILSRSVRSLEAAGEMEIKLRQLRFHAFVYAMDPDNSTKDRWAEVEKDHRGFEAALEISRKVATPEEGPLIAEITQGYKDYRKRLAESGTYPRQLRTREDFIAWADAHPVQPLLQSCNKLLDAARETMNNTARSSEDVGARTRAVLIALAVLGPLGGSLAGYGVARALSRTIAQLRIRIEDVHARLDQEAGAVEFGGLRGGADLNRQFDRLAERVGEMVGQFQRQQQEILRAEQLAAVGRLAASIAHEVRNPLTSMKLLVGAALAGDEENALTTEDLRVIHREIGRLERTVQGLLDFARPAAPRRAATDLRAVAAQALDLVRARAQQQGVALDLRAGAKPAEAEVDRDQMETVLVNLFLNGLDAMPGGGRLTVEIGEEAGGVVLEVRDTGPGVPESVKGRLFTPFTTTKETGTGLGLSICRRVVREHGGEIAASDGHGRGACFTVTLPRKGG
jgi:two-component system sensor histidine kinase HydH